jgi:hypothetical protein
MLPLITLAVASVLSEPYDTLDAAALAAEAACAPISFHSGFEFGGAVIERGGKFYFTRATTSHSPQHIDLRVAFSSDYKLAALYHTHPGTHESDRWFSTADVQAANTFRVPSYIAIQYENGDVRRHTPGITPIEHTATGETIALGDDLMAVAVHYGTVTYNGAVCRVRAERGSDWLVECGVHLYLLPKADYTEVQQ